MLGYPYRKTFLTIGVKNSPLNLVKFQRSKLNYSQEQKQEAVIHLVDRETTVKKIAKRLQVTRKTLYDWKEELIGEELPPNMSNMPASPHLEELKDEVNVLKRQVYRLRMEKDILEKSFELIKKNGASIQNIFPTKKKHG